MVVAVGSLAIIGAAYYFMQTIPPVKRLLDQVTNRILPNVLLDPSQYLELYMRGNIKYEEYLDYAVMSGLNQLQADNLMKITFIKLGVADIIALYRRGKINEDEYKDRLKAAGLNEDDLERFKQATEVIPSPSDIIRFAVREVYSPETAKKYGQFEDLPKEFTEKALELGMSEDLASNYWAAHWELPSFTQGQDMLARGILTEDDFRLLAKSLDIMPYWREKMLQLSYAPFTRVDARRMFQLGVLTEEQLKRAYMDIGYNETKAGQLVEFTKKDILTEERDFTKTELFNLYSTGEVNSSYVTTQLKTLGYTDDQIQLLISLEDYKNTKAKIGDEIDLLFTRFQNGVITYQNLQDSINKLDLPSEQIDLLLAKADRTKHTTENFFTKSELNALYKLELITLDDYKDYMSRLNYPPYIIDLYTKLYLNYTEPT